MPAIPRHGDTGRPAGDPLAKCYSSACASKYPGIRRPERFGSRFRRAQRIATCRGEPQCYFQVRWDCAGSARPIRKACLRSSYMSMANRSLRRIFPIAWSIVKERAPGETYFTPESEIPRPVYRPFTLWSGELVAFFRPLPGPLGDPRQYPDFSLETRDRPALGESLGVIFFRIECFIRPSRKLELVQAPVVLGIIRHQGMSGSRSFRNRTCDFPASGSSVGVSLGTVFGGHVDESVSARRPWKRPV